MTPIEVFGGRQYLVLVQDEEIEPVPHLVAIPKEGDRVTLNLERQAPELASSVRVAFRFPPEWSPRGYRRGSIELAIEDAETHVPFAVFRGMELKDLERSVPVPPRKIRIVAKGMSVHDSHHGTLMYPRDLGRAEALITVRSGVEQVIPLALQPGGKLRVHVSGRIRDEEIPRTQEELHGRDREGRHWSEAWLTLLDAEGREVEPVLWAGQGMRGTFSSGIHLKESWPLGESTTSEMLPSGAYTLRARLLDRPPLLAPVTITIGETTDVKLVFP